MARQKGIIKLEGTIGDISFYKSKDGFLAREKGGVDADRIANDPAFQRTRENGAEFGKAGSAGKLFRIVFRSLIMDASDSKMVSRLTKVMMKVIQADLTNERGKRNVIDGEAELLKGFEFNEAGKLSTTLFTAFSATMDRATGDLTANITDFIPEIMLAAPNGATHFKLDTGGAAIDFENGSFVFDSKTSGTLPINNQLTNGLSMTVKIGANSPHPLFLLLGVDFFQEVNGTMYPLKNGAFNSLSVIEVDGI
jgi:hypothetical protein